MNIRKYRLAANLTQKQLSALTGISLRHIRSLESGRINPRNVRADTAFRLAAHLNTTAEELLGAVFLPGTIYISDFEWFTPTPETSNITRIY